MRHMQKTAYYHLPGLFEFYELYRIFLPLFREHREYFYDWCDIGSIYGAPPDCIWGGGRVSLEDHDAREVLALLQEYSISARLTFSNSLLRKEHLSDRKCNELCDLFAENATPENGVTIFVSVENILSRNMDPTSILIPSSYQQRIHSLRQSDLCPKALSHISYIHVGTHRFFQHPHNDRFLLFMSSPPERQRHTGMQLLLLFSFCLSININSVYTCFYDSCL